MSYRRPAAEQAANVPFFQAVPGAPAARAGAPAPGAARPRAAAPSKASTWRAAWYGCGLPPGADPCRRPLVRQGAVQPRRHARHAARCQAGRYGMDGWVTCITPPSAQKRKARRLPKAWPFTRRPRPVRPRMQPSARRLPLHLAPPRPRARTAMAPPFHAARGCPVRALPHGAACWCGIEDSVNPVEIPRGGANIRPAGAL